MSRQLGSLHSSNSHPTNLTTPITIIPLFAFPPPDFPTSNVTSGMNSDTNSHISVFYTPPHNSITQILKPPMNLPTLNHLHPIIFTPTPQYFPNPLFNQYYQITLSPPILHPLMLPKSLQPILPFTQTDHPILQIPPKSPQN